eukprot:7089735-Prorocentrum_lima.AAC.1
MTSSLVGSEMCIRDSHPPIALITNTEQTQLLPSLCRFRNFPLTLAQQNKTPVHPQEGNSPAAIPGFPPSTARPL